MAEIRSARWTCECQFAVRYAGGIAFRVTTHMLRSEVQLVGGMKTASRAGPACNMLSWESRGRILKLVVIET